jgi:hypothetical protein
VILPATVGTVTLTYLELGVMDGLPAGGATAGEVGVAHQHPNLLNRGKMTNQLLKTVGRTL